MMTRIIGWLFAQQSDPGNSVLDWLSGPLPAIGVFGVLLALLLRLIMYFNKNILDEHVKQRAQDESEIQALRSEVERLHAFIDRRNEVIGQKNRYILRLQRLLSKANIDPPSEHESAHARRDDD